MIELDHAYDWGPPPDQLNTICQRSGCALVLSEPLPDGTSAYEIECPSHDAKVRLLANLAEYDARHPLMIRLAEELAKGSRGDPEQTAAAIVDYVKRTVRFVPELREKFQPTGRVLELGFGDCDCSARAVLALLRAAGLEAGLQTIGNPPRHVAAVVLLPGGWRWADASIDARVGEHPIDAAKRLGLKVRRDLLGELGQADGGDHVIGVANLVTMASLSMGIAWVAGKGDVWALASIVADELDGWVARELGEASELGSLLDWGTDLALTPAVWMRLGWPLRFLPIVVGAQIAARNKGIAPSIGSVRAALMAYGVGRNWLRKRKRRRR